MVIKKCKICGKEFDAKANTKCCGNECSKINKKEVRKKYNKEYYENNYDKIREKQKEYHREYDRDYYENNKDDILERKKEYYKNNRDDILEQRKEYYENHRDEIREQQKKYYENNHDEILQKDYARKQEIISELNAQYDGDLNLILENIPSKWHEREAKMLVWFNESYYDGIIAKIESTPVCEVTGKKEDLVTHHLNGFNTHPELGNDIANMVRITQTVHNEFHSIYGYGNNTPEQWGEFIQNRGK